MGQRSQIYVRYNNGDKKGLIANYYPWNFGERMISRASGGLQYIRARLNPDSSLESSAYEFGRDAEKLSRFFDVNFDMGDIALSINLIKEHQEEFPEVNFNEHIFLMQDNNDGKLLVDIDNDVIKYAFLDDDANIEHIMDAEMYMDWDRSENWRVPTKYLSAEDIEICKENIQIISDTAQLMTKEEVLDFIYYDYTKDLGISRDDDIVTIDNLAKIEECGLAGIGECVIDVISEEDNDFYDIGKALHQILIECCGNTERRKGIEQAILAITGYNLSTITGRLKAAYSKELDSLKETSKPVLDEIVKNAEVRVDEKSSKKQSSIER